MYVKWNWVNPNTGPVTINIYRAETPLDRNNLGTPFATLTGGETEYTDTAVLRGKTYYYVFETVIGTDRVASPNYQAVAVPRRGPGPAELKYGDFNYGYFGTIESAVFITAVSLAAAVGLTAGVVTYNTPTWHKFVRNNKICFIPAGSIRSNINWKNLYDAGLVFGKSGPGPYNAGANVDQLKTVTIGPDTFIVRLMRGYNDDDASFLPSTSTIAEPTEAFTCEWDDFVYPIYNYVPQAQRMVNVANNTSNQLRLNAQYGNWVQERPVSAANTANIQRGSSGGSRSGVTTRTASVAYNASVSAIMAWWPVLELIEP